MGLVEKNHQRELLAAQQARLDELELRAARQGYSTPPEVLTEIDQLKTSTARLRDALDEPLPAATVAALSPDDRYQGHVAWQMRLEETIYHLRRELHGQRKILWAVIIVLTVVATRVMFS